MFDIIDVPCALGVVLLCVSMSQMVCRERRLRRGSSQEVLQLDIDLDARGAFRSARDARAIRFCAAGPCARAVLFTGTWAMGASCGALSGRAASETGPGEPGCQAGVLDRLFDPGR